jgi:ammonium transporter Rh
MAKENNQKALQKTALVLLAFQILMMILWGNFTTESFIEEENFGNVYNLYIGVEIMIFFGFGYLMTFMSRYGLGAVGFTMMIAVVGIQYGILVEGFFKNMFHDKWGYVHVDMFAFMDSLHLVATVLVSFGALIGKVGSLQIVALTLIEGFFYALNKKMLLFDAVLDLLDAGGTISIHMFGALFGVAAAFVLGKPPGDKAPAATYVSDLFSLVGTIFLWIYWPSFNGGALEPNSQEQQRAIANTILGLCASTVGTFIVSTLLHPGGKLRPVDVQNATLAGGVATGAVCHMTLNYSDSLMLGFFSGSASSAGFAVLQPWLEARGLHDSCGVLNLHGIPALIGGLASVVLTAVKGSRNSDTELLEHDGSQWQHQTFAILLTVVISLAAGAFAGFVLRLLSRVQPFEYFDDSSFWEVADEEEIHGEKAAGTSMGHVDSSSVAPAPSREEEQEKEKHRDMDKDTEMLIRAE